MKEKNVKQNKFLKIQDEIIQWLDNHGIKNYTLIPDETYGFVIDVDGDVNISKKK